MRLKTISLSLFYSPTSSGNEALKNVSSLRERNHVGTQSDPTVRHHFTGYPPVLQERHPAAPQKTKTPINRSSSHRHLPFPFFFLFSLFLPPHHLTTPSPQPPHPALHLLYLLSFFSLSRALGLLFMASPVEDALLYKTLEPSSRPTPFEDVAHNSYLGL